MSLPLPPTTFSTPVIWSLPVSAPSAMCCARSTVTAWVADANEQVDENGTPFLQTPTEAQVRDAINAAQSVGDDHIQRESGAPVNPESWTHGSSEQRERWFVTGYQDGYQACDTFAVSGDQL